jgi:hypothetical protein
MDWNDEADPEDELGDSDKPTYQVGISKIFYYFSSYTNLESGRAVGRKIGVVQEIIVRKLILQSQRLSDAVVFEPQLHGFSGASHKVEFVFLQVVRAVELEVGQAIQGDGLNLQLTSVRQSRGLFRASYSGNTWSASLLPHQILVAPPNARNAGPMRYVVKVCEIKPDRVRLVVLDPTDVRASVESKRVGAQRFKNQEKLGSGIQTIEKAKQAALVAIDADLKFNGMLKAQFPHEAKRRYISVVVLGNGVHWTEKDKHVLGTYVDYTFLVPDETIIRYADWVRQLADETGSKFLPYFQAYFVGMTKTAPDKFDVSNSDFLTLLPADEPRSLTEILEAQIDDYPVELSSAGRLPSL